MVHICPIANRNGKKYLFQFVRAGFQQFLDICPALDLIGSLGNGQNHFTNGSPLYVAPVNTEIWVVQRLNSDDSAASASLVPKD